jgi:uncharacterized protein YlzI (FlbEa/FlbD family)
MEAARRAVTYVALNDQSNGEVRKLWVNREAIDYVSQEPNRGTTVRLRSGEELLVSEDLDDVMRIIGASAV